MQESPELILAESGEPFKTESAGRAAMSHKNLSGDDYHVVKHNAGWAIVPFEATVKTTEEAKHRRKVLSSDKNYRSVFDTEDAAFQFVDQQDISQEFKDSVKIKPLDSEDGGFRLELPMWRFFTEKDALAFKLQKQMPEQMVKIVPIDGGGYRIVERYWKVKFNARSAAHQEEQVVLIVDGETLTCRREREVVLPQRFLESADHTLYPVFHQVPGEDRKRTSYMQTFPYQRLEESTEEAFFQQKAEGTKKTKKDVQQYGYDVDPETLEE